MKPEPLNVLYVEDNPVDADLVLCELAQLAPQVQMEVVTTIAAARKRLETASPCFDVILTDLRLPDGNGLELLAHVRDDGLPMAVVIITGFGDQEAAVAALKSGADDYLTKRPDSLGKLPQVLYTARERFLESRARRGTPLRVLYAEPNPFDSDLARRYFSEHAPHIQLTVVNDGADVLAKLPPLSTDEGAAVDVLLLDYRLPGFNALEIIKALRLEPGFDIPIVLVTGQGNEDVAIQALRLGVDDYLVKHVNFLHQLPAILEKVKKQAELRLSESRYRELFDANPHPMWVYDLETLAFLAVNDAAVAHYGYSHGEFLAMTIKDIRPAEDVPNLLENIARVGEGLDDAGIWRHKKKDGSLIDVEIRSHTLMFNGRRAEVVLAHDVTERHLAEQERQTLVAELEKRNAELDRFTYTVSHDLKSPLVTILGFIGQLKLDLANADHDNVQADLTFIGNAANQMRDLLDNLLQLSRAGRTIGELQPVNLPQLVRQVIEQVGDRLVHARLQVTFPAELPDIKGDPMRLREVFQNLLENAAKFTADHPDPDVEVGCVTGEGEICCHVRDNGIGIPAEYQEKVFGLFEQLDPDSGGTGIGLTIVRRIIEEHGGRIWIESAGNGHGSTFFFTLPT